MSGFHPLLGNDEGQPIIWVVRPPGFVRRHVRPRGPLVSQAP
jgi:hypothetical protein